jgi:hypothetical protein
MHWSQALPVALLVLGLAVGCGSQLTTPVSDRLQVESRREPFVGLLAGASAFNLTAPREWADTTSYLKLRNPNTVAALSGQGGVFLVAVSKSRWARFHDIPMEQLDDIVLRTLTNMAKTYQDVRLIAVQPSEFGGLPARAVEYTASRGEGTFYFRQHLTVHNYELIQLVATSDVRQWEKLRPIFHGFVASFRFPGGSVGSLSAGSSHLSGAVLQPLQTGDQRLYGNSWAVIIGVNRYRKAGLRLRYAVNDAQSVRDAIVRFGFPEENVFLLLDEAATKRKIQEVLGDELRGRTGGEDRVFVFFAGHGMTLDLPSGGQMGYLLPVDGDPDQLHASALPMAEIRDIARLIPAKHMFFVIDACYSGLAAQRSGVSSTGKIDPVALVRNRLREVLTAGERDQPVVEEDGHGVFTRFLLQGLAGEADFAPRDGMITGFELASWLIPRVQGSTNDRQTPFFGRIDGVGDFVFVVPRKP